MVELKEKMRELEGRVTKDDRRKTKNRKWKPD